ncbi:MAG: phenylalanine--tRNA ligase subunit beta [Nanoarchaeota archaeon]
MANVKFPRKKIEKHFKLDEKMLDRIMMLGIPVESLTNEEIEIQILPNRPDLLSMQGFVRAVKLFIGKSSKQEYKINKSDYKIIVDKSVEKVRPYCMAAVVKGIKLTNEKIIEIMQWQEKVHTTVGRNRKKLAMGYYVLNKIKFPIKYTTKTPKEIIFEPLDMPQKMDALQILSRHPTGREYAHLLEGFDKFPVFYDSNSQILSIPPIINSDNLGKLTPETSEIFIECSGSDLNTLKRVISLAVMDLIDQGGKAYSVDIAYGNKTEQITLKPEKMRISLENTNKLLGLQLKESDLVKLLPKMGYEYEKGIAQIPQYRTDILHEVDIIEDIAIAYGYENITPEIPKVATIGEESIESQFNNKIADIIAGLGLLEISSYHLIKQEESVHIPEEARIEVENSKTEYKILRPNLSIPTLRILSENKDNEYPQRIFELGTVFKKDAREDTGIKESNHLCIACSPSNFTEIKQILDYLSRMLNIKYELKEITRKDMIEGRTGEIIVNNKPIGHLGEVHPSTLREWGIKMPVAMLELSVTELIKSIN